MATMTFWSCERTCAVMERLVAPASSSRDLAFSGSYSSGLSLLASSKPVSESGMKPEQGLAAPERMVSHSSWRLIASEMAWRTRTSLKVSSLRLMFRNWVAAGV